MSCDKNFLMDSTCCKGNVSTSSDILWNFQSLALYSSGNQYHVYMSPYSESTHNIIKLFIFERVLDIIWRFCMFWPEQCLCQAYGTCSWWSVWCSWRSVRLPMETFRMWRHLLTLSLVKVKREHWSSFENLRDVCLWRHIQHY
jgi:hypothetical protein